VSTDLPTGVVNRFRSLSKGAFVALKKLKSGDYSNSSGLPLAAVREMKFLQELRHENIVAVHDMFYNEDSKNMIIALEFARSDLVKLIDSRHIIFDAADVKQMMLMILRAVDYCHKRWVLHRDIKPGNILIGSDGLLKLTDFGSARIFGSPDRILTPGVCTQWYRAPELLFGAKSYGYGADMWSVGCVFAELLSRKPLFMTEDRASDLNQVHKIFSVLGTPVEEDWPGLHDLSEYSKCMQYQYTKPVNFNSSMYFEAAGSDAVDLLHQFLKYHPNKRITAEQAMKHKYFTTKPLPSSFESLRKLFDRFARESEQA
jgi:cyclin-dependent kinase 7